MPKSKLFILGNEQAQRQLIPNNLPVEPTRLIGREHDVEAALHLLEEEDVRLLTLTGPGGVGKTRLALRLAEEVFEEFSDGVYFVELASVTDPDQVVPTIARTLQVQETRGSPLLGTLKEHLQDKRMLLVLDNFEQIIPAGQVVSDLLASCSDLRLLVTSRAALRLRSEHLFTVSPLALPEPHHKLSVDKLSQYGAITLFNERARAVKPDFEFTSGNAGTVAEICRRLDGIPLGIELVAAYASLLPPQSLLARLRHPLRMLTGGAPDAPERHQTMRDTIEWSYNLLDESEQRLFRRLGVFVGSLAVRAAEAVCNETGNVALEEDDPQAIEVLKGLRSLVEKNLLRRLEQSEDEDSRLAMLEVVREYAWEQLAASGEIEAMERRHTDYFLFLATKVEAGIEGPDLTLWLDRLNRDQGNLRASLGWLLEQKDVGAGEDLLLLLVPLRKFWDTHTRPSEYQRWLEKALEQAGHQVNSLHIRALRMRTLLAVRQGSYAQARVFAEQAVALAEDLGDRHEITEARSYLAGVALAQGDYDTARSMFEEALNTYRELGAEPYVAAMLNNLGEVAQYQGDFKRAQDRYRESLSLFRARGEMIGVMLALLNLGHSAHSLGKLREAREDLLEAMTLAKQSDSPVHFATAVSALCSVMIDELRERSASRVDRLRVLNQVAQLSGLAARLIDRSGRRFEPVHQAESERTVATVREQMGDKDFTSAWEEGQAMSFDQALGLVTHEGRFETASSEARGQSRSRAGKQARGGLTSREYETVTLVARSMTNAEIARQLVLSERTVEMHVSHALHKLGLATRTELAAWAMRWGLAER